MKLSSSVVFLIVILLSSCMRSVVMDSKEDRLVVVHCILTTDSIQILNLEYTSGISDNERKYVDEAEVKIVSTSSGEELASFNKVSAGKWEALFTPVFGCEYELMVDVPTYSRITSKTTFPADFSCRSFLGYWLGVRELAEQFPLVSCVINSTSDCHLWVSGLVYNSETFVYDNAAMITTDHLFVDNFNITSLKLKDSGYPLIEGNDINEVKICGDMPMYKNFLRISHPVDYDNRKSIVWTNPEVMPPSEKLFSLITLGSLIDFYSVSTEYDLYLKDAFSDYIKEEAGDLTSLYKNDNHYTNIENGLGVFGGVVYRRVLGDARFYKYE